MKHVLWIAVLVAVAATLAPAEVRIPLLIQEHGGSGRSKSAVSNGVPLLPGQVSDVSKLVLLDAAGEPVLAQFRPLARWWQKDNSLRWVLVDFKGQVPGFGTQTYVLSDRGGAPTESPLKAETTDDAIVVTTGPAQFTINRKAFNLFDRVRLDVNADGAFTEEEEAVHPDADHGSVVTDTYGVKYFSSEGTTDVRVEEAGPVRVCVVAKGTHKARGGAGYSHGMYGFEVRIHFYAGLNLVKLDALITNNGPKPNGSPTFDDYSLVTQIDTTQQSAIVKKQGFFEKWGPMGRIYGVAPTVFGIPAGTSRLLYQDNAGSEHWQRHNGLSTGERTGSFRGYRIIQKTADGEKILTGGDQARGLSQLACGQFGVTVIPRDFWQMFPKAVELFSDGRVRVGILPGEYKAPHFVEDASATGMLVHLNFFAREQKPQWARDGSSSKWLGYQRNQPWPHVIADDLHPLFARATPKHYAACGALADVGPYLEIPAHRPAQIEGVEAEWNIVQPIKQFPLEIFQRRCFMTDYLKDNAYGWQVFGTRWEEFAGHSPWNYEPIGSSFWLFDYINTGAYRTFYQGIRRGRHFRDVRAYKIDGTDVFSHGTFGSYRQTAMQEDYCNRRGMVPKDDQVAKYSQGKYSRRGWFLPNPAHCNLDNLYDMYCLFGDQRAYEGMRNIAATGGIYVGGSDRGAAPHRASGWSARALLRYFELTGDKEALNYLKPTLDHLWDVARTNRTEIMIKYDNAWFFDVWSRAVVMAYKITGDERMRDLAIGACAGRDTAKSRWATMNAFCWEQTGQKKYASTVPAKYARLGGYFPACAGYMWGRPRDDAKPPAAVKDLAADAVAGGVKLTWTAPGDDGSAGRAAVYQVKYDDLPLVEMSDGKTTVNFWAALNCAGEPAPGAAGAAQSFVVKGLAAGTYHFALKSRDEVSNESGMSNVVQVTVE